jgi:hypothetical protein
MNLPRWLASPAPKQAHHLNVKKFQKHAAIRGPACFICGQQMLYVRTIPRLRRLPKLQCYECRRCRLGLTEEYAA